MNKHKRFVLICLCSVGMASIVSHAQDKDTALLIQQLEHTDRDVRNSARQSLAKIGEAAVPSLILASGDLDVRVRR